MQCIISWMSLNFSQIQTVELAALVRLKCYKKVYSRSNVNDPMATCFVFLCNSTYDFLAPNGQKFHLLTIKHAIYKDQSFLTTIHVH